MPGHQAASKAHLTSRLIKTVISPAARTSSKKSFKAVTASKVLFEA